MTVKVTLKKLFMIGGNKGLPPIMDNFFIFRENTNNLRNFQIISNENKRKSVRYGSETISYRTPLLWAGVL